MGEVLAAAAHPQPSGRLFTVGIPALLSPLPVQLGQGSRPLDRQVVWRAAATPEIDLPAPLEPIMPMEVPLRTSGRSPLDKTDSKLTLPRDEVQEADHRSRECPRGC